MKQYISADKNLTEVNRPSFLSVSAAYLLATIALSSAGLVFLRALFGPIARPFPLRSPMNAEGIFALSLLLLTALRSQESYGFAAEYDKSRSRLSGWWSIALLITLVFLPFLSAPMVADDYEHIWNARHITWNAAIAHFAQPEADRFFRPLVYLFYAAESLFAGLHPTIWRSVNVTWHIAASLLTFNLLRRLTPNRYAALFGALTFALHGSRPEVVFWISSLFDLMATTFGLAGLVLLLRKSYASAALFLLFALLCKESAFVFPLLAMLVLRYTGLTWRDCFRRLTPWFIIAFSIFVYRLWLLGGIGGYQNAGNGKPTIFNLRLSTTLKGFLLRSWAASIVPLNWTTPPTLVLALALFASLAALVWFCWRGADRRLYFLGLGFFFIAALPVHQFLSIGDDLEKSRVLYLPSVGMAMILASCLFRKLTRGDVVACTAIIVFQGLALSHNLGIWRSTALVADKICRQAISAADSASGPISVQQLPNVLDGVYFLKTGFPACVFLPRPDLAGKVSSGTGKPGLTFRWDEATRRLVPVAESP